MPAAVVSVALLLGLSVLQAGLVVGAPWGAAVLGGRHPGTLPPTLRAVSAVTLVGYLFGIAVVLGARGAGPLAGWSDTALTWILWALAVITALSALGNLAGGSRIEKRVMAPIAIVLAVCFAVLALA
jgi:hypothetical protein